MSNNFKIVILEDDTFFGNLLKNYLMSNDYENIELYHDEDVFLSSIKKEPTLLILDHHLIHSTGLDVLEKIKEKIPSLQFIYLSGQEYSHIAIKALRLGALEYIEKDRNSFINLKRTLDEFSQTNKSSQLMN